ncbi:hypothetical protein AO258_23295 [Pseudomonas syringae ICMP 19498]|nr:hypothetical protein AO258_23295 [Pseudomonas syringae ICMP 19498]
MRATVSAEKVEKVVSPPQKPVIISKRHSGLKEGDAAKSAMARPMMYPPTMFATTVPGGIVGNRALSFIPKSQRNQAPSDAPMAMTKSDFSMTANLLEAGRAEEVLITADCDRELIRNFESISCPRFADRGHTYAPCPGFT